VSVSCENTIVLDHFLDRLGQAELLTLHSHYGLSSKGNRKALKRQLVDTLKTAPFSILMQLTSEQLKTICDESEYEEHGHTKQLVATGTDPERIIRISLWAREHYNVRNLLTEQQFFALLDKVMIHLGRAPLQPNSPQQNIIQIKDSDRVLQILAGPGSGKTEMVVWRVLYELTVLGTEASRIMVTTFTKKAAQELLLRITERTDLLLTYAERDSFIIDDPRIHDLRIGTIHSLCDTLLAEFDDDHMENGVILLDDLQTQLHIRKANTTYGLNKGKLVDRLLNSKALCSLLTPAWNKHIRTANDRVNFINKLLSMHVETWMPRCHDSSGNHTPNGLQTLSPMITTDIIELQKRWEEYLVQTNVLDFCTLQKRFWEAQQTQSFGLKHVFVDEFQDTNPIQFAIHTAWLRNPDIRLTTVGDDDQAMYRFRGSDIDCYQKLGPHCAQDSIPFRMEKLEDNWRSTQNIVRFAADFKKHTILNTLSMPKKMTSPSLKQVGTPTRYLEGDIEELGNTIAQELKQHNVGTSTPSGDTAAILLFSTSESSDKKVASILRSSLEAHGINVSNFRNKTAGKKGNTIGNLLGLLSYFFDPIRRIAIPTKNGIEVAATKKDKNGTHAFHEFGEVAAPANYEFYPGNHLMYQNNFRKNGTRKQYKNITLPPEKEELLQFIDELRAKYKQYAQNAQTNPNLPEPALTISGLVARLLSFPYFRDVKFSMDLFRQAHFTELVESNIAPTRTSWKANMDTPITCSIENGKLAWEKKHWDFLKYFGDLLEANPLDDQTVDAFSENTVSLLTFHQSKGLEFDHVYVGATGRDIGLENVLTTALFSGQAPPFTLDADDKPESTEQHMLDLAQADREREVFVAITRAQTTLTIIHDPALDKVKHNPAFDAIFSTASKQPHPLNSAVTIQEYT